MQSHQSNFSKEVFFHQIQLFWTRIAIIFTLVAGITSGSALAATSEEMAEIPDLFVPLTEQDLQAHSPMALRSGHHRVRLNARLGDAFPPTPTVHLSLPSGAQYEVIQDHQMVHASGSVTWVGYLRGYGNDYRVLITTGQDRSFGRILTPDGELLVESDDSGTWLIDPQEAGWLPDNRYDDAVPPPFAGEPANQSLPIHKRLPFNLTGESVIQPQASAPSTVDVMLLYTPGMAARHGSGLQARLDNLIALANQAYLDSQVNLTLRLVHKAQVNYSETTSNGAALEDLTNSSDASLANVTSWRDQYGADLVALLRPYSNTNHRGCGMAWINGFNGQALSASDSFAVASDGNDTGGSWYFCDDYTLAHELGHAMGNQHDRANATNQGAYPYSYGYGSEGGFGTIMSYINPRIGKFSNPNLTCAGSQACGIADYADNARSLNNTRATVASFKTAQTAAPPPAGIPSANSSKLINLSTRGWVGTGSSVMIGGFILGEGASPRKVIIRAIGPSLANHGVTGTLANPRITLMTTTGQVVASNDDWGSAANATEIQALGKAPKHPNEAAILITLDPNVPYTPIVEGVGGTTGNALVEVYDVQ